MPISKEKKQTILADLTASFREAEGAIFTDFRGVDVAGMTALRAKLRAQGSRYVVTKRALAERALAGVPPEKVATLLAGATGIAFTGAEPIDAAKILVDFKKDYETFLIKGGLLGGEFVAADWVVVLAATPPREVLIGRLLGAWMSPATAAVGLFAGLLRKFLGTLTAIADKRKEADAENKSDPT